MDTIPLFSVIVPTRDRHEQLAACLDALAAVEFAHERYEVVVSDDGSASSPAGVVARFADRLRVRLVTGPKAGPGAARNRGAAAALGRFLVFTDDDCLAHPGWLASLERSLIRAPDDLVAGAIVNGLPRNPFSTATQLIVRYVYAENERRTTAVKVFCTCNLAMSAELFRRTGGFSEAFPLAAGEDHDFCYRWQDAGLRTTYAADAVVRHEHPLTARGFLRQHFNYGRGLYRCRRLIAERQGTSFRVQSLGFYLGLVGFPLKAVGGGSGVRYACLVLGSQVATLAGAAREWLASDEPADGPVPSLAEPDGA